MFDTDDMIKNDLNDDVDQYEIQKNIQEATRLAQKSQISSIEADSNQNGADKAAIDKAKMLAYLAEQLQENVEGGEFDH